MTYDNKTYDIDNKGETEVKNDLVLSSVWELNDGCAEVPVKVIFGDETKDYVKAYPFSDNKESKIKIIANELDQAIKDAADFNLYGVVLDTPFISMYPFTNISIEQVYKDGKVTYGDNKELPSNSVISSDSTITVTYEFNDRSYSKLTVHSEAFKDGADVVLYVKNGSTPVYSQVLYALCGFYEVSPDGGVSTNYDTHGIKPALKLDMSYGIGGVSNMKIFDKDHNALTSDGYYLLTGWNNGAELLDAAKAIPSGTTELTLDSELNGYYVIFMVNGEYEVVKVPYGELAANKCTLGVDGLNHWVYLSYDKYTKDFNASDLSTFNFTKSQISVIESLPNDHKTPIAVFVACFYPSSSTAYAVFDAGNANFGNEYVTKIITSGKVGNSIILPKDVPSFGTEEDRTVFIGWDDGNEVPVLKAKVPVLGAQYSSEQKYEKNLVSEYAPTVVDYTYKITFYNGSEVVGIFYYDGAVPTSNIVTGLVAFENNEKAYAYPANGYTGLSEEGKKAFNNVKFPHKDGYTLKQWNDVDGKKIITVEQIKTEPYYEFGKTEIKDMKDDLSLYAKFDANKYTIVYNSAIAAAINEMKQDGYVDDPLKLLSEATFSNEGHKLLSWNTRADGLGDSYKLGADFTLTGAQYEDLKDKDGNATITLYAIWDTTPGSGDNPGGSTGGDGDNTALYLIAGMLAIIAILAIVGIVLMRRKN